MQAKLEDMMTCINVPRVAAVPTGHQQRLTEITYYYYWYSRSKTKVKNLKFVRIFQFTCKTHTCSMCFRKHQKRWRVKSEGILSWRARCSGRLFYSRHNTCLCHLANGSVLDHPGRNCSASPVSPSGIPPRRTSCPQQQRSEPPTKSWHKNLQLTCNTLQSYNQVSNIVLHSVPSEYDVCELYLTPVPSWTLNVRCLNSVLFCPSSDQIFPHLNEICLNFKLNIHLGNVFYAVWSQILERKIKQWLNVT